MSDLKLTAGHTDAPGERSSESRFSGRILFACDTPGHTAGYHVVARAFRDAGFEVIMTGQQMPEAAALAASQEDVALVAYRIMDRDPVALVTTLRGAMTDHGVGSLPILVGGIVGKRAAKALAEVGVVGVFGPGSKLTDIVACAAAAVGRSDASDAAALPAD